MPTQNTVPIDNAQGQWQIWNYNDIYTGPDGTGRYVPKVGDEVHQIVNNTKTEYVVAAVDANTLLSTLQAIVGDAQQGNFTMNALFGVGPGTEADTYQIYIDKSVTPYRLGIDRRCSVAGSTVAYCKIFSGSDYSAATGNVISAMYDSQGNFLSENVTLELVGVWQGTGVINNTGIQVPKLCWTNASLVDGDIVTVVFYDASGFVVSKRQLVVINTGFIRDLNAAAKEVIGISLETPFLASTNSTLIQYPVNVPINALNLIGVVTYSDGSLTKYAVDQTKFSVSGLDAYAPTIVGQEVPLVLKYQLQPGEVAYGIENQNSDHISQTYTLQTILVNGSYSVQLYCYPEWVSAQAGYKLRWWLYDLDRSIATDVTSLVAIDTTYAAFQPLAWGVKQTLRAVLNLNNVNASYATFYVTQYVDIVINNLATVRSPNGGIPDWQVSTQSGHTPMYGTGVHATFLTSNNGTNVVNVMGDYTDYNSWLQAYMGNTLPLYNPSTETTAPAPTHFALVYGNIRVEYPISQWNQQLNITQALANNSTVYLQFFKRTTAADLQLCVAGVPMWQIDALGNYL